LCIFVNFLPKYAITEQQQWKISHATHCVTLVCSYLNGPQGNMKLCFT
jgi:hypothetical protein